MDGWVKGRLDRWMGGRICGWMDGWVIGEMDKWRGQGRTNESRFSSSDANK